MQMFFDLTPIQISALIELDTPGGNVDSVGRRLDELSPKILLATLRMVPMGLVMRSVGWQGNLWFRLTPEGRAVRNLRPA